MSRNSNLARTSRVNIFFIGGIHGAGKTTYCKQLAPAVGARHLIASRLVRERRALLDGQTTQDLGENQSHLIEALEGIRKQHSESILLDGHYCLFDSAKRPSPMPIDVFRRIAPSRMLLLEAEPAVVEQRLLQRDGISMSIDTIKLLAAAERDHANALSAVLQIRLLTLDERTRRDEVLGFLT